MTFKSYILDKEFTVQLMCGDGFAGRSYYMLINGVQVEVCLNNGDNQEAAEKTISILKALGIVYPEKLSFKHDGRM